jgi:hypothetical protein
MVINMERGNLLMRREIIMMENGKMIKNMEMGS